MPRLFPALPYQKAPSLCQCNSSSCAPCPVSCCLSRPVSRIAPSLVLRHLSYHTVSCIMPSLVLCCLSSSLVSCRLLCCVVSRIVPSLVLSYRTVSSIAPSLMSSLTPIQLSQLSCPMPCLTYVLPCLTYCPVSRIALSLVSSLMPRLTLTSDERTS